MRRLSLSKPSDTSQATGSLFARAAATRRVYDSRNAILAHLDQEKIQWEPCAGIASDNGYESYAGDVYVDVPFDPTNPTYARLASFLEHPDGSPKHPGVNFCYVPLASAMKNAHHDEPGYIPEWIKEFNEPWKPVAQPPHSD